MPRVSYSCEEFRKGLSDDPENENLDFCKACYRRKRYLEHVSTTVVEENALELECDHPPYEGEGYTCEHCRDVLGERDD